MTIVVHLSTLDWVARTGWAVLGSSEILCMRLAGKITAKAMLRSKRSENHYTPRTDTITRYSDAHGHSAPGPSQNLQRPYDDKARN